MAALRLRGNVECAFQLAPGVVNSIDVGQIVRNGYLILNERTKIRAAQIAQLFQLLNSRSVLPGIFVNRGLHTKLIAPQPSEVIERPVGIRNAVQKPKRVLVLACA